MLRGTKGQSSLSPSLQQKVMKAKGATEEKGERKEERVGGVGSDKYCVRSREREARAKGRKEDRGRHKHCFFAPCAEEGRIGRNMNRAPPSPLPPTRFWFPEDSFFESLLGELF